MTVEESIPPANIDIEVIEDEAPADKSAETNNETNSTGFWSLTESEDGQSGNAKLACDIREIKMEDPEHLNTHHEANHTEIKCDKCTHVSINQANFEEHLTSKHKEKAAEEELNSLCDTCDMRFTTTPELLNHKEIMHKNKVLIDKSYMDNILADNNRLSEELANLKDDFERLNDIFETSKNTATNASQSNDIELEKVREEFRVVKAQHVFLVEKNETLFKLGNIALDNKANEAPEIEVVSDQDEDGLHTLVTSALDNRNAGYYNYLII